VIRHPAKREWGTDWACSRRPYGTLPIFWTFVIFLGVTLCRIQYRLDHAFDMPVRRGEPADIDPQVARGRGTHLIAVKRLALDFARFQDILGQRVENSFRPQLKAKAINATDETPLPVPDIDKARSNPGAISAESRPSPVLVDMGLRFYSSHHLRRI
jgi:hypothetical protein